VSLTNDPNEPGAVEVTPLYGVSTATRMWAYGACLAVVLYTGYLLGATR